MKTELRKRGRSARESLSREESGEKSRRIVHRLRARPEYREARTIFCYLSVGGEVESGEIVAGALREGKRVAVPLVSPGDMSMRAVLIGDPRRDLAPGFRGIPEPANLAREGIEPEKIDLAVVPGTAFDPSGNRLGRGAGCYDRFLPRIRAGAPRVGLAFECQVQEEIPAGEDDVPVDLVVTEDRVIETRTRRVDGSPSG